MFKLISVPLKCIKVHNRPKYVLLRSIYTCSSYSQDTSPSRKVLKDRRILSSPYSDVVIPNGVSFTQYLFDKQEKYGDRTAMVNGETGQEWTHHEIREKCFTLASAFARLGFSKGDVVAIMSPSCPDFVISFLGLVILGVIPTTLNSSFTADEIKFQIENAESVGVVCHKDKLSVVREACKHNQSIRHIISFGAEREGVLSLQKLLRDDGKGVPNNIQINEHEDLAVIPYSSGTTGLPKGVMLSHRNLLSNLIQVSHPDVCQFKEDKVYQDTLIGILPMYHIYGMMINIFVAIKTGSKVITMKEFNQNKFVKHVARYKPTVLPLVPPLLSFLENSEKVPSSLLDSVNIIVCGAAPIGQALLDKFFHKFGKRIEIYEGYGMTELSPVTHMSPLNGYVIGSCGFPVPNTITKLINPMTGNLVDIGECEGELCIKGPQIMKGYLKNEKATRETIIDGWLHTGDVARIDENENVYIVDRIKELIKVKGLQVAPAELENLLRKHPGVEDVAVIGIPDERAGELPKAFVVASKDEKEVSEEELKQFVAKHVAAHKHLACVQFIDEIPKSAAGKILRKDLRNK